MRGAARAIGWELVRHHRWGLLVLAAYLPVLAAAKVFVLGSGYPIRLDPPNGMAGFVIAPVSMAFFFFVGVFSYGFGGDLAARQSIYPARLFTLPVSTAALAGWPMLYGTAATSGLWLATATFLRPLADPAVPFVWPALLTSAYLAWTQAFMWMPYGLPGLRVAIAVIWLAAIDAVVLVALHYHVSELWMIAMLAPQLPLAYVAARAAVARARRGDVPDWRGVFTRRARTAGRAPFPSASRAQSWFEGRRSRSLAVMAGIVVPAELLLLFVPGNDTAPVVLLTLVVVLVTPPFLAIFASAAAPSSTPFTVVRPLSTAALAAAKLRAALRATFVTWLITAVATSAALWLSGTWPLAVEQLCRTRDVFGAPRTAALALLVITAAMTSTWKQLVQGLCIGLTGRQWVIKSTVLVALSFLVVLGPLAQWLHDSSRARAAIWDGLPLALAVLASIKMCAAVWIAIQLHGTRAVGDRTLVAGAACWSAAVFALYGVLLWFVGTPLVPHYVLMLMSILAMPLVRPSAAPLALAWNRHR